ncbi:MAG: polysaccharide biosynthesis protein [Peptococcales bacterium]|jgi:FlaA1/EpsC-like NDP-sugar epimerase
MGKGFRNLVLLAIDSILINMALYAALLTRFDGQIPMTYLQNYYDILIMFTVTTIICFYLCGLYNRLWRYASINELLAILMAVTAAIFVNTAIVYFLYFGQSLPIPRSVILITGLYLVFFIGGSRIGWRLLRDYMSHKHSKVGKPILIVGAGDAGVLVMKELKNHFNGRINIVGFIDDDKSKHNSKLLGVPVLGDRTSIPENVEKYEIEEIILAMPSVPGNVINEIIEICHKTKVKVKILPGVYELIEGKVSVNQIREVEVEDLLGRKPVKVDLESISHYLTGQVVLVTGAGGSIGSELCRQIMKFRPKSLLLLDVCENNVYDIEGELRNSHSNIDIYPLVKDVRDKRAIEQVFQKYRPNVIFHAAAHKHVPLMEVNPEEAIKNNVLGTYNVAQGADKYRAKKFVLISTDKAVRPTSVMGASKRVAEMIIQYLDMVSTTDYAAVRFGNVLGSRGSVVPLFKKQIEERGPVTVTHPEMVRYFMTIPEAVQLVIQAGSMARGGEIFVLDMGEPVKIVNLAKTLIKLSGFEPNKDIDIVFTGIRPGEKLYEELLIADDHCDSTTHQRIFIEKPNGLNIALIEKTIHKLLTNDLPQDERETMIFLQNFIPEFRNKKAEKLTKGTQAVTPRKDALITLNTTKVREST